MTGKILNKKFFDRNAILVAQELLGKYLVRQIGEEIIYSRIVETESYEGLDDKASHAHRGQTPRNTPMFGEPGTIYVYFTYGMHWMLNITCGKKGHPSAVLIRGVESVSGPARLTKKLGIDKMLNGKLLGKESGLWVAEFKNIEEDKNKFKILKTPRIGIASSGPVWSKKLHRFVLVSKKNEKNKK